jgi:DNA-binding response OmpR family regulator
MPIRILVADDNIDNRHDPISELPALLQRAGYEVVISADGERVYDLAWERNPDLIVLDIRFGRQKIDGIEICEALRAEGSQVPIILVTAILGETEDVLRGFEAGADDYVIRPRDNREILARVRANLPPEVLDVDGRLRLDFAGRHLWVRRGDGWQEAHLQPLQYELLHVLVMNAGLIVPSTTLKEAVWGKEVGDGVLAVYIRKLRQALEPDPDAPVYIETIRGLGYRFNGRSTRSAAAKGAARPRWPAAHCPGEPVCYRDGCSLRLPDRSG